MYGSYRYVYDTIKGTTRPNRVSQGIWALIPFIGVGAALSSGAGVFTTIRTLMSGLVPLTIFFASFINRTGYWRTTKFDYVCAVLSLFALILWLGVRLPEQAILLAVVADLFAAIPTIRKSWTNPESETGTAYIMGLLSVVVIIPTIKVFDIPNTAFQIYLLTVNSILVFCIYRRRFIR